MSGCGLLVLRPEPGAALTAVRAQALGLPVNCYPLFQIVSLPWAGPAPEQVDAVMFTSANGARHGGGGLARYSHLPAFAVGEATAQAVHSAGFGQVHAGTAGVQALIGTIAAQGHRNVLHIAGRDVRPFDAWALRILSAVVYASVESGSASELAVLAQPGTIALVHSARAGKRLAALLPLNKRSALHLVAISDVALDASGVGWASAVAASAPDEQAMLALAAGLCD